MNINIRSEGSVEDVASILITHTRLLQLAQLWTEFQLHDEATKHRRFAALSNMLNGRLHLLPALQSLEGLSLFQNYPPLSSILRLNVSSSFPSCSSDLPQLNQATSICGFQHIECVLVYMKLDFCKEPVLAF